VRAVAGSRPERPLRWTAEENRFYLDNIGHLSYAQIGQALGRSEMGVILHAKRTGMPAFTRVPGYLTAHQVGTLLGLDTHKVPVWIDTGVMPGERMPDNFRPVRRMREIDFKLWIVRPSSWIYFQARNIKNPSLRRLVELAQAKWGDEWLTTREAADLIGCQADDIERQIKIGRLTGLQAKYLGARHKDPKWIYWYVRRSHVIDLQIVRRKGGPGVEKLVWSPRADAFLIKTRKEGKTYEDIARLMKWPWKRVKYRLDVLKKRGLLA
jgi:hypothetical protein